MAEACCLRRRDIPDRADHVPDARRESVRPAGGSQLACHVRGAAGGADGYHRARLHRDAHAYGNANRFSHLDTDCHTDADCDADTHLDVDTDCHTDADCDTDAHLDVDADCYTDAD